MNNTKKPLAVTIVIPAYNEETNLVCCLDSIAQQEVMPDRVLVIDNNSKDGTKSVATSYPFVEVIPEKQQGIVYARNRGFDAAKDGIIARIDADTVLPNTWVKDIKTYYADTDKQNTAITGSGYFRNLVFPPKNVVSRAHSLVAYRFNRFLLGHYILWGSNMAMTVPQWQAIRSEVCYDADIHEDLDLAIHLHRHKVKIVYLPKLQVGVMMRRVLDNWTALYGNLMLWPTTLKRHQNKAWLLGMAGAYFLLAGSTLVYILNKPVVALRKSLVNASSKKRAIIKRS